MMEVERPKIEGSIKVGDDRRMGFARVRGPVDEPFLVARHPGARRQIPLRARAYAAEKGFRLLGLDRPGVGHRRHTGTSRSPEFPNDLITVADALDADGSRSSASRAADRTPSPRRRRSPTGGGRRHPRWCRAHRRSRTHRRRRDGTRCACRTAGPGRGCPIGRVLSSILSVAKPSVGRPSNCTG